MSKQVNDPTEKEGRRLDRVGRDMQERDLERRIPAGQPITRLTTRGIPKGYRGYWAKESQFSELLDAGYTFVYKENVEVGSMSTRNPSLGSLIRCDFGRDDLYLMKIREDWYQENMAEKQKIVNLRDAQIHGGTVAPFKNDYRPKDGINFTNTTKNED